MAIIYLTHPRLSVVCWPRSAIDLTEGHMGGKKQQKLPTFVQVMGVIEGPDKAETTMVLRSEDGRDRGVTVKNNIVAALATGLASRRVVTLEQWMSPEFVKGPAQPLTTIGCRAGFLGAGEPGIGFLTAMGFEVMLHIPKDMLPGLKAEIAKIEAAVASGSNTVQ